MKIFNIKEHTGVLVEKNMTILMNELRSVEDLLYDFYGYMLGRNQMYITNSLEIKKDICSFISSIKLKDMTILSNAKKKFLTNGKDIPIELYEIDLIEEFKKQKIPNGFSDCYIKHMLLFIETLEKFLEQEKVASFKVMEGKENEDSWSIC